LSIAPTLRESITSPAITISGGDPSGSRDGDTIVSEDTDCTAVGSRRSTTGGCPGENVQANASNTQIIKRDFCYGIVIAKIVKK